MKEGSVFITGGCGMVGSHLVDYYYENGLSVVATKYKRPTIDINDVKDKAVYIDADVRDADQMFDIISKRKPLLIYHLAAQSYPTVSWERPVETMDINVNGTINIFEAIKKTKKEDSDYDPMVLIACSSAEYGASLTPDNTPVNEDCALLPLHPYGVSKVGQDLLGFQYYQNDGIRNIRVRIFNTTGPRKTNDVASDFCKRAVDFERGLIDKVQVGNLSTQRAITDVRDLVQALLLLAEKGNAGDVYNVSGEKVYLISDILATIEEIIGRKIPTVQDPKLMRSSDEPVIFGNSGKMQQLTNWQQKYNIKETLQDMIAYIRSKAGPQ